MTWFKQMCLGFVLTLPWVLLVNAAVAPPSYSTASARGPAVMDLPYAAKALVVRQGGAGELRPVGVPESHKSEALALPEPKEVSGKTRLVTIAASTKDDKAEVEWVVFNLNDETPVQALANGRTLLVFPNDADDVVVILCYVRKSTEGASSPVRTLVKVKGSTGPVKPPPDKKDKDDPNVKPPPGPDVKPPPPPPPSAKVAHLSFVIDPARHTVEAAAVINDRGLREKLAAGGVRVHSLTTNSRSVTQGGLSAGVTKAGGLPCVILQDGAGNILEAVPLRDVAGILALAAKYGG